MWTRTERGTERVGGRRKKRSRNEEYQVLLRIRGLTVKDVSSERIRSVKNMTSFQIGRRRGKTDANNVELRWVEREAEGVLVSCPLFYLGGGGSGTQDCISEGGPWGGK